MPASWSSVICIYNKAGMLALKSKDLHVLISAFLIEIHKYSNRIFSMQDTAYSVNNGVTLSIYNIILRGLWIDLIYYARIILRIIGDRFYENISGIIGHLLA